MNAMEQLASEIRRIATLREQYAEVGRQPRREGGSRVLVEPALMLMDEALDRAIKAAGSGEALDVVAVLRELAEFRE